MKNTSTPVCVKTAFVGLPPQHKVVHALVSYNNYFRKCLKLVLKI
jgi:hypothetical protein